MPEVGAKWKDEYKAGQRFAIQPNINYKGTMWAPGYSYRTIGGDATYIIIPNEFMEEKCLLPYTGENYFGASLSEPLSCVAGTFKAMYHTTNGVYEHQMGIKQGGKMALLASVGPMGLAAIDYIIHVRGHSQSGGQLHGAGQGFHGASLVCGLFRGREAHEPGTCGLYNQLGSRKLQKKSSQIRGKHHDA